ncbi:hypothetical protein J2W95_001883 [Flavobacterium granuli]|uniref:Uncharacterized protein n=1 Tax=Flavobacterium granuli TaxID=280093 RepID=A0ABU1S2A2_9FLAO|nr:hypothetical protein [Flavobacterium granuli]
MSQNVLETESKAKQTKVTHYNYLSDKYVYLILLKVTLYDLLSEPST